MKHHKPKRRPVRQPEQTSVCYRIAEGVQAVSARFASHIMLPRSLMRTELRAGVSVADGR